MPELGKSIKKKNSAQTHFIINTQQKLTFIKKKKNKKGRNFLNKLGLLHNGLQPPTNQTISN